ncbi:hypothetical protein GQR58_030576 [Nymphon striatum]|nr:hypothetical protein GQR58_030576 [Nymphon striatum]
MTSAPRRNFAGCSGASQPASMMACEHTDPILKTATLLRRASSTASSKAHVGGDSNEVLNRRTGGERDGVDASLAHCPHERFRRSEVVGHRPSKRVGADGPPMEAACTPSGQERYLFVAAPICSNADGVASEGSEHGPMVRADCFLAEQSCIESGSSVVAEGTRPAGSTRLARLAEGIVPAGHCVQDLVVGAIADEDATGDLAVSDRDPAMHLAEWVGELQAVVGGFGTPKAGDLHPQQFELGGKLSSAEGGDAATQSVGHHSGHLVAGRDQPIDPLVMACYLADGRDRGGRWLRKCHRSPHRHARQFLSPASSASSCRGLIPAEKTTMSASSRSPEACRRPVTRSSPSIRSVAKLRWVVIPSSVTHERSMVAAGPSSCWGIRRSAISTTWVVRLRFRWLALPGPVSSMGLPSQPLSAAVRGYRRGLSIPGMLGDRVGKARLLIPAQVLLFVVYALLFVGRDSGSWVIWVILGLHGTYYAMTDVVSGGDARFQASDRNYWGVSFLPDGSGDYTVTFGSADTVEVLQYSEATNEAEPLNLEGSCPSVSPDGRFIVYKRADFDRAVLGEESNIRLVLHDTDTGQERLLGETRFVDDQVEWLDEDTIVYAIKRDDEESIQPAYDVWSLDLDPTAEPQLLVPFADSPAVYRDLEVRWPFLTSPRWGSSRWPRPRP